MATKATETTESGAKTASEQLGIVTRSQIKKAREAEQTGLLMPLPLSGGVARVKRLSLMDKMAMGYLPEGTQQQVLKALNAPQARTAGEMERNRKETLDLADRFCIVGFLAPRLVATEAELDESDPYCVLVGDLHPEERIGYFLNCVGRDAGDAMRFRSVPDGAE